MPDKVNHQGNRILLGEHGHNVLFAPAGALALALDTCPGYMPHPLASASGHPRIGVMYAVQDGHGNEFAAGAMARRHN